MMVAFVIETWGKRNRCHLNGVARQLDALEWNETLKAAVDVNLNFSAAAF